MPIMVDKLAHKYWQESHYNTIHKHDGNTHVHKELKKAATEERDNTAPSSKIKVETSDYYLPTEAIVHQQLNFYTAVIPFCFYHFYHSQLYPGEDIHPPEFASCLKNEQYVQFCVDKALWHSQQHINPQVFVHFLNHQLC